MDFTLFPSSAGSKAKLPHPMPLAKAGLYAIFIDPETETAYRPKI
jgi:hypothetical protein